MMYNGKNGEYFEISEVTSENCELLKQSKQSALSLIWFESDGNRITIDTKEHTFNTNTIVCLTEFHKIEVKSLNKAKLLRFNRPFYCILDHDSEVGCKGILFFGASNLPILNPNDKEEDLLKTVWKMLALEMESRDNLQLEMLQMMLKRILILCTRIYKNNEGFQKLASNSIGIVRDFNFLVEQHFKEKHGVAEYATMLHKSPKTLANLFKKLGDKTPLQYIQQRIMVEARRLLNYSEKNISDIAYDLGYNDVQSFSRFFKKQEGLSPLDFRNNNA